MRRLLCAVFVLSLFVAVAAAQDVPKVEVFGGYALERVGFPEMSASDFDDIWYEFGIYPDSFETKKFLKAGFLGSVTYNATDVVGIEADFRYNKGDIVEARFSAEDINGTIKIKYSDFSFLVGPRFALRQSEAVTPFAHFLIGVDRAELSSEASAAGESASVDAGSDSAFAFALGGGLDVNVNENFGIRLIQADYIRTKHWEEGMNNLSLAFGVVVRF